MSIQNPNIEWYLLKGKSLDLPPRCPFATVENCPRFYQSLSLLSKAGSTKIPEKYDRKLLKKWKKSPLWPVTDEQATSISGPKGEYRTFSNFCPEVSYERFGIFAHVLVSYTDEIDRDSAYSRLSKTNVNRDNWRWVWAYIQPLHYSECPLYSVLANSNKDSEKSYEDIIEIKPGLYGIGLNLNALWRKLIRWIKNRN